MDLDMSPSSTFHQFSSPRCPNEIRDLIWEWAVAVTEPRVIQLTRHATPYLHRVPDSPTNYTSPKPGKRRSSNSRYESRFEYAYTSTCKIPALLHTSGRSRDLALKQYQLSFAVQKGMGDGIARIYFDAGKDVLPLENEKARRVRDLESLF